MTVENIKYMTKLMTSLESFDARTIEATMINYVSKGCGVEFFYKEEFVEYKNLINNELLRKFEEIQFPLDIEMIIEFFEYLLEKDNITENGIVFTPKYISDFISDKLINNSKGLEKECLIIDPGCGCGIFLVSATKIYSEKVNKNLISVLNENIYGIDLDEDNVRRCKIVLNLFILLNGQSNKDLKLNIIQNDSLKNNWAELFKVKEFDYIIGNPPYVNAHDMKKETIKFLKETFSTTKTGTFNIFYAFIEHAIQFLSDEGKLGYIIPNNFLTIKSATNLRRFLVKNNLLNMVIDFSNNMVFKPIRTYNCIVELSKTKSNYFEYSVLDDSEDIETTLNNIDFQKMELDKLDENGWRLVDKKTLYNIELIEGQYRTIKDFIRTGIATLKDEVYIVNYDGNSYYKMVDKMRYEIEPELVKTLYKIPDLKKSNNIKDCCKYILFPYKKGDKGFEIISEACMLDNYPNAYNYLKKMTNLLATRDKGKTIFNPWYAFGRTQGLNKYGKKLVFPTFSAKPKFIFLDDEYSLFCNGYAVFENDYIELDVLQRILNSIIMNYYISNTSYAIEGGYYCYQKKYIERFSVPFLTEDNKRKILTLTNEDLDKFLIDLYGLEL